MKPQAGDNIKMLVDGNHYQRYSKGDVLKVHESFGDGSVRFIVKTKDDVSVWIEHSDEGVVWVKMGVEPEIVKECNPLIVDKVVEAVRKDLLDRSNVGIEKYGTTLDGNPGNLKYWLQHAYEETLDKANYLKRAIMQIEQAEEELKLIGKSKGVKL